MSLLAVERIKLLSTRSPWWCAAVALVLTTGFAGLFAGTTSDGSALTVGTTQIGSSFGLMVVMVMAALAVTTEYRFGTIRATFQAVPNRSLVLLTKTGVVALLAGLIGEAAAFCSWGLAKLVKPAADLGLDTAAEWRQVAGAGLVYALAAVVAVAVGTLVRHSAGAITLVLVWSLLVEKMVMMIPKVGNDIYRWMPFNAATHFQTSGLQQGADAGGVVTMPLSPWGSLAYFAAFAAATLIVALVVANRRDV
ncbi:ABC-2 type transport system permease protein [Streptoalloteichus tenebrarius]|uniref:ABC-2 type transport system permease protein n=1 Tax=Streptoalloteichus tenebrarius (strain ATCC 17920 / DSM 40477 / JCM 4838 / CBS 697.72 / NBRC 16177 / NCIMB 11028 / NRRL B-12390 / A12253. 1 / ISP 5477) TaxID=1933 RepID=A0ABT1I3K9_STRSD|nr:hypothetical protein [Streptoalloteichus tenebrarius]MCP2262339.1 ABC-2 type transport system permease protein [Streptoalloteichus tenebrarius]BFF02059.1 ABC transporter permease [Streptoalloteichus tenebrarius]